MNISFITSGVVLLAVAACGCARSGDAPRAAAPTTTPSAGGGAAEVIGALKLVRQEYANAVPPEGGKVADATEYAETELFAEQAESKLAALAKTNGGPDETHAAPIRDGIARTRAAIARQAPPSEVAAEAGRALALVEELLAGAVPEEIRGAVLATTRADQAIGAEEIVGEYRVGVTTAAGRPIYVRQGGRLAVIPTPPASVYLGVLLRERRTKRPLPASKIVVVLSRDGHDTAVVLHELWGDFHQYGANVPLPADGPLSITIQASAPAYARHGDMLTHFVAPVSATIAARVQQGTLRFDAHPVQPADSDYAIGDDVLQARTEAGALHAAGPYLVGLIVEGPEPVWTWKETAPVLQPVAAEATNHVEVVLLDRDTGQLVPNARVALTFLAGTRTLGSATLLPLLSIFSHYGQTLALPAGVETVLIHVDPPDIGSLDRPRLEGVVDIELPLPARRTARLRLDDEGCRSHPTCAIGAMRTTGATDTLRRPSGASVA